MRGVGAHTLRRLARLSAKMAGEIVDSNSDQDEWPGGTPAFRNHASLLWTGPR